jgi:hypothetical protein
MKLIASSFHASVSFFHASVNQQLNSEAYFKSLLSAVNQASKLPRLAVGQADCFQPFYCTDKACLVSID